MATDEMPFDIAEGKEIMTTATQLLGLPLRPEKAEAQMRNGLPYKALERTMRGTGFSLKDIARSLGIPLRTLMNHKGEGCLSANESDKLYRFTRVFSQAEEMTGSAKEAHDWLTERAPALGGVPPITLLASDYGTQRVEGLIGRIMWGMG
jgi:putative toxin-antitoxin system antitoxin component (TIGR02293 family)